MEGMKGLPVPDIIIGTGRCKLYSGLQGTISWHCYLFWFSLPTL